MVQCHIYRLTIHVESCVPVSLHVTFECLYQISNDRTSVINTMSIAVSHSVDVYVQTE